MALDTRSKRASSVNFLKPYALALVLPDGVLDQGDRQHTIWDYSGIPAAAAAVITGLVCVTWTALKPAITFTALKPAITFTVEDCE